MYPRLAILDRSAKLLFPSGIARYGAGVWALHKDEHNVVEAILVKFCHCFHIGFILLTLKYLFDTCFKLICQRLYFLGCVSAPAAHGVRFH